MNSPIMPNSAAVVPVTTRPTVDPFDLPSLLTCAVVFDMPTTCSSICQLVLPVVPSSSAFTVKMMCLPICMKCVVNWQGILQSGNICILGGIEQPRKDARERRDVLQLVNSDADNEF